MKIVKRMLPAVLSTVLILNSAMPAFAAGAGESSPSEKEEVIYITLSADGSMKNTYVVNSFSGGNITDYGDYDSVKMLNTDDTITMDGDKITLSSSAKKVYYQGELTDVEIPWNISLSYYLDGTEYSPEKIAGKSGNLEIYFKVTKNPDCQGSFFENYALQASFTLDTELCENIAAPDATIANVGSAKQLTYTILPGQGIDTVITADVTDFEMSAVSINGIRLNLNVEVDDTELQDKVNELIDAVKQLDDGAADLSDGSGELSEDSSQVTEGAASLDGGISALNNGVTALQNGLAALQDGLDSLNAQSSSLVNGSAEVKNALLTIQTAVNSISAASEDLALLTEASGQIQQAIDDLYDGAAALQANLGYAQYKALMAQYGLDIDTLQAGNTQAISGLQEQISELQDKLAQLENTPGMDTIAALLKAQLAPLLEQLERVITLLEGNNAAISGTESYLDGIASQLPALTEGLAELKTRYKAFDASISQLVNTLSGMMGNLSALSDGLNQLVEKYGELDEGIGAYTDGVATLVAGYRQVMEGVSSLTEGSGELVSGSGQLCDGTAALYEGAASLWDGAQELSEGTGQFREETSDMNTQIEEEIHRLLESIEGSTDHPQSFVSEKNTNVASVQFVIQTEGIEAEEAVEAAAVEEEELSFWQKLLQLFGL